MPDFIHAFLSWPWMPALAIAGVVVDRLFGEPRRWHPLVGFGRAAACIERALNVTHDRGDGHDSTRDVTRTRDRGRVATRLVGVAAWVVCVCVPVAISLFVLAIVPLPLGLVLHVVLLWFALGARSLDDHIRPIGDALRAGDLGQARTLTARIVTRDTSDAGETALARAAIESALENGNDAIFGALFWFALAGGPGALAFRLTNTLDAMWGYRTPRFLHFGWAAARLDDVANYVPARLTALAYALCSHLPSALHCWRTQAAQWDSPNAGPVMASGAGGLRVLCGGVARYHGVDEARPVLGTGQVPGASDVGRALDLVRCALWLWLTVLISIGALGHALG
ncbi:MAG TPA: CobD/CbiB family cobalamin biosynthesis protein [Pararobbsia sp.]|jgi:adenosylcobinamide-phosphate synthase|nr:CobD/CbiB family cobalamin biosynthesis protein [Pararobbsia sp.]